MNESTRMPGRRASGRAGSLVVAVAAIAATLVAHAVAAPPSHPDLNPLFAAEWWLRGHATVVDPSGVQRPSDGVDAIGAWPSSSGDDVVVAVADSGVDATTPALRTQLLPGRDFLAGRQSDGIFGVAPGAQILPLRVANARGHVPARAAAAALAYAARDPRVRVINMSWRKDFSPVVERALRAATRRGRALLVSAAGNDARDLSESRELPQTFDDVGIVASCTPVPELVGRVDCDGIVNARAALTTLPTIFGQQVP